jgi:exportin-7
MLLTDYIDYRKFSPNKWLYCILKYVYHLEQSEHFPFLGNSVAVSEMRCRSMFYTSLGRLLMVDLGEDEDIFDGFMLPLTGTVYTFSLKMARSVK